MHSPTLLGGQARFGSFPTDGLGLPHRHWPVADTLRPASRAAMGQETPVDRCGNLESGDQPALTFINDSQRQFSSFAVVRFIHGIIEPDCMAVTADQLQI